MLLGSILLFLWFPAVAHQLLQLIEKALHIDEVAYVRFASVYRQFADVESFFNELQKLMGDRREPQK